MCQKAHIFDPRRWHGADQQRGVRSTVVGYTARRLQNLDQDVTERLRQMGFKYRRFHPRPAQVAQLVVGAAPAPVGAHLPRPGLPPQATKGTPPPQPLTASGQQARVRPWACSKLPRPTTPPSERQPPSCVHTTPRSGRQWPPSCTQRCPGAARRRGTTLPLKLEPKCLSQNGYGRARANSRADRFSVFVSASAGSSFRDMC